MVLNYVKKPSNIILADVPAIADLSISDALKIAKEIENIGKRTLEF